VDAYTKSWVDFLKKEWLLENNFASLAARLVVYCYFYNLRPTITSGYRSRETQAWLVDEWKRGNPNVHTPLPPGKSLHNNTTWIGSPASLALDMVTSTPARAGIIARYLGITWGGPRDPVHFATRGGHL
jgi:hypothetical protein